MQRCRRASRMSSRDSIPLLSLSSREAQGPGLVRVLLVEQGDRFEFVDIFCRLPVGLIEAGPFNKVLQSSPVHSGVEDAVHKPFLLTIDLYRRWHWLSLSGEGVFHGRFE